jgi:hypothetical protein
MRSAPMVLIQLAGHVCTVDDRARVLLPYPDPPLKIP